MEKHIEHKKESGSFFAYLLIIIGVLWLLKRSGWDINFPGIGEFFSAIGNFFIKLTQVSADITVPLLIILAGIVLIAGRRFFGALLLALIIFIVIPHFLIIPGILMILFFPVILVVIGIIILSKLF
jgi:hypothetical protein